MAEKLERQAVAHIARLARVHLTDAELDVYADQLGEIISHFDVLDRVNTDGVEPTAQIQPLRNVMVDDVAQASLPQEVVLALAPVTEDGYLRVRKVLE
jgi:aspartyl-tRNA(Asn)/glutamyl-tRNA(Gln) amidotransferase subunit C